MASSHPSPFGVLLRRHRLAAGLTQEVLAERAGTSARGISDVERGVIAVPRADTVQRLADALKLTCDERAVFEATAGELRLATQLPPPRMDAAEAEPPAVRVEPSDPPSRFRTVAPPPTRPRRPPQRVMMPLTALVVLVTLVVASLLGFRTMVQGAAPQLRVGAALPHWGRMDVLPGVLQAPTAVAVNRQGYVYVADVGYDRVSVFSPSGVPVLSWGSRGRAIGQFRSPGAIALDSHGRVYVADTDNDRVQIFSADGKPLAHWGTYGSGPGQLEGPDGIAVDPQGLVYVSDPGNGRVEIFYPSGKVATALGNPDVTGCPAGSLALGADGTVYIVDAATNTVNTYSARTRSLETIAGDDTVLSLPKSSPHAPFSQVQAVAVDGTGRVYATDPITQTVRTWENGSPVAATWSADGHRLGSLQYPSGVAVGPHGNVYVTDAQTGVVEELSPAGKPVRQFGTPAHTWRQMRDPEGVAAAPDGTVYVADTRNDRVLHFSSAGRLMGAWGDSGSQPGQLRQPTDLAAGPNGDVYVLDKGNSRVQRFSSSGALLAVLGTRGPGRLTDPAAIAFDPAGILYVVDRGDGSIVRFRPNGSFAGRWHVVRNDPNPMLSAFVTPIDVAVDSSHKVYVLDAEDQQVHILLSGGTPLPALRLPAGTFPTAIYVGPDDRVYLESPNRIDIFSPQWQHLQALTVHLEDPTASDAVHALAADRAGNLYVADPARNRIQKFVGVS